MAQVQECPEHLELCQKIISRIGLLPASSNRSRENRIVQNMHRSDVHAQEGSGMFSPLPPLDLESFRPVNSRKRSPEEVLVRLSDWQYRATRTRTAAPCWTRDRVVAFGLFLGWSISLPPGSHAASLPHLTRRTGSRPGRGRVLRVKELRGPSGERCPSTLNSGPPVFRSRRFEN